MKTKSFLFILAAALLLSFTVITNQPKQAAEKDTTATITAKSTPESGFASQDPDQW